MQDTEVEVRPAENPGFDDDEIELSLDEACFLERVCETITREKLAFVKMAGGSMAPSIRDGEWVRVEHAAPQDLRAGDIVLYRSLSNTAVAHRIVRIEEERAGNIQMITQGDSCRFADAPIPASRVIGRVMAVERQGQFVSLDTQAMSLKEQLRAIFSRSKPSSGSARES